MHSIRFRRWGFPLLRDNEFMVFAMEYDAAGGHRHHRRPSVCDSYDAVRGAGAL